MCSLYIVMKLSKLEYVNTCYLYFIFFTYLYMIDF